MENRKYIFMRSNIIIPLESKDVEMFFNTISENQGSNFIKYKGRLLNTADITGIFTLEDIENKATNGKELYKLFREEEIKLLTEK